MALKPWLFLGTLACLWACATPTTPPSVLRLEVQFPPVFQIKTLPADTQTIELRVLQERQLVASERLRRESPSVELALPRGRYTLLALAVNAESQPLTGAKQEVRLQHFTRAELSLESDFSFSTFELSQFELASLSPSSEPSVNPSGSAVPSPSASAPTPEPSPSVSASPTPEPTPTASATPTPEPTPEPTPSATVSATPEPTASPEQNQDSGPVRFQWLSPTTFRFQKGEIIPFQLDLEETEGQPLYTLEFYANERLLTYPDGRPARFELTTPSGPQIQRAEVRFGWDTRAVLGTEHHIQARLKDQAGDTIAQSSVLNLEILP